MEDRRFDSEKDIDNWVRKIRNFFFTLVLISCFLSLYQGCSTTTDYQRTFVVRRIESHPRAGFATYYIVIYENQVRFSSSDQKQDSSIVTSQTAIVDSIGKFNVNDTLKFVKR